MTAPARQGLAGLLTAALGTGLVAGVAVLSIRAQDAALAGLGIAAIIGLLAILTRTAPASLGTIDPAWTLALLLRGRLGVGELLPIWAAQAVGAVGFGALAGRLVDDLRQWSIAEQPGVGPAAAVVAIVALAGAWAAVAADAGQAPAAACGLPALGGAAAIAPTFAAAANPAGLFALGVAGIADWEYVFFTTVAALAGAVVGAFAASLPALDRRGEAV